MSLLQKKISLTKGSYLLNFGFDEHVDLTPEFDQMCSENKISPLYMAQQTFSSLNLLVFLGRFKSLETKYRGLSQIKRGTTFTRWLGRKIQ